MTPRVPGWLALGLLGLCGATSLSGSRRDFRHGDHVQSDWFRIDRADEVARDCRGCHGYEEGKERDPQSVCRNCHYAGAFELEADPGFEEDLEALRSEVAVAGFRHADHLALTCYTCHAPLPGTDTIPIPRGVDTCAGCHDPSAQLDLTLLVQSQEPTAGWRERFYDTLNDAGKVPSMGPDGFDGFLHTDHLRDVDRTMPLTEFSSSSDAQNDCGACHLSMRNATARTLQENQYSLENCGRCHQGSGGEPQRFAEQSLLRPSRAALTFSHADHLTFGEQRRGEVCGGDGYERIEQKACHACHVFGADRNTYDLKEDHWKYAGCVACHDGDSWSAAGTGPRADRDWWHGKWDGCERCHEFGTSDMKDDLHVVDVLRLRPKAFLIETHAHPFITQRAGTNRDEECSQCHVAPVAELPSRLIPERTFSHATHLPPYTGEPENREKIQARCVRCHEGRVRSATSLLDIDPGPLGLTYDPAACGECHVNTKMRPVLPPIGEAERRTVLEFPHDVHVDVKMPDGTAINCLTCHVGDGPRPTYVAGDVGVITDAASCVLCHRHDARSFEFTGGADHTDVGSCRLCHVEEVPAVGTLPETLRKGISGLEITQLHPSDPSCSTCHALPTGRDRWWPKRRPSIGSTGAHRGTVDNIERSDVHDSDSDSARRGPADSDCLDCHWNGKQGGMGDPTKRREELGNRMSTKAGTPYPGKQRSF